MFLLFLLVQLNCKVVQLNYVLIKYNIYDKYHCFKISMNPTNQVQLLHCGMSGCSQVP